MLLKKFRQVIAFLVCCLVLTTGVFAADTQSKGPLSAYKGKWVFVNYWASWCEACVYEIPALNRFYQKYQNKAVILGINYDGISGDELDALKRRLNIEYPLRSSFPIGKFGIDSIPFLPTTIVFNPQGKMVTVLQGPQNESQLARFVK